MILVVLFPIRHNQLIISKLGIDCVPVRTERSDIVQICEISGLTSRPVKTPAFSVGCELKSDILHPLLSFTSVHRVRQPPQMLIFDFDGVMVDSLDEVIVTAHNSASPDLVKSLEDLPRGFEKVFRANRYHVQPAADFPVLSNWCLNVCEQAPETVLTRSEYRKLLARDTESPTSRRDRFFGIRKVFVDQDLERWLNLNRPYNPLWESLIEFGGANIVIMTNKNRDPVIALCHHFGLRIESRNVYSAEVGASKTDNLNAIHERFGKDAYYFIDDSVPNLSDLDTYFEGRTEFTWLFATWGYVGPQDREEAERLDFPCLTQEEFVACMPKYA